MASVFTTLKENPILAIGIVAGTLAGGVGGAFLGGTVLTSVLLGVGLGAAGMAVGGAAGHLINRSVDRNTAAPMGVKIASSSKLPAGAEAEVSFKPSVVLADRAMGEFKKQFKGDPEFKQVSNLPMIGQMVSYTNMRTKGKVSEDGNALEISHVTYSVPMMGDVTVDLKGIRMPVKDGKIDENHPAAKEAMKKMMYQSIDSKVPERFRERAKASVDTLLSKSEAVSDTPGKDTTKDRLVKAGEIALKAVQQDTPEDDVTDAAKKSAPHPGKIPDMKPKPNVLGG